MVSVTAFNSHICSRRIQNDCHENASCTALAEPNSYVCAGNHGFRDTNEKRPGRSCDYVDHCIDSVCPEGCECSSIYNATSGEDGFYCEPKKGFTRFTPPGATSANPKRLDAENHVCVSPTSAKLVLNGGNLVLKQGESYSEMGVSIEDENEIDMLRKFSVSYERAEHLMEGDTLTRCGMYT